MLSKNDFIYDKRLTERFIARGNLTRKAHQEFLAGLPDVADKAEPMMLEPAQDEASDEAAPAAPDAAE
ncbi:MAG: hypothetical protein CSA65_01915 [Proteobacteria bacterium]|nr:MAG: hypothetical protein CSA65_01915 [Pseudomonadota bacterium]